MHFILDIESKPQDNLRHLAEVKAPATYKDPEKIKAYIEENKGKQNKNMSVSPDLCEIKFIGVKPLDGEPMIVELKDLHKYCQTGDVWITFNGKKFDIPALIKAMIKQGLEVPRQLVDMRDRYSKNHIDLMEVIGEFGDWKSLDFYLQVYLGISKKEIDFDTCSDEELREHCLNDICNTEQLYNLFKVII